MVKLLNCNNDCMKVLSNEWKPEEVEPVKKTHDSATLTSIATE